MYPILLEKASDMLRYVSQCKFVDRKSANLADAINLIRHQGPMCLCWGSQGRAVAFATHLPHLLCLAHSCKGLLSARSYFT